MYFHNASQTHNRSAHQKCWSSQEQLYQKHMQNLIVYYRTEYQQIHLDPPDFAHGKIQLRDLIHAKLCQNRKSNRMQDL